jgi:hypothetical protein
MVYELLWPPWEDRSLTVELLHDGIDIVDHDRAGDIPPPLDINFKATMI